MSRCEICGGFVGPPDHDENGDCVMTGSGPMSARVGIEQQDTQ